MNQYSLKFTQLNEFIINVMSSDDAVIIRTPDLLRDNLNLYCP